MMINMPASFAAPVTFTSMPATSYSTTSGRPSTPPPGLAPPPALMAKMQPGEPASLWLEPMKVQVPVNYPAPGLEDLAGTNSWSTLSTASPRDEISSAISSAGEVSLDASSFPAPTSSAPLLTVANSIADLQELLQTGEHCCNFRCPPGVSILHWAYTLQRKDNRALHRAVVSFLHNGVPKHVAGERCFSKKHARQSAADLALALVQGSGKALTEAVDGCIFVELADLMPCGGKGVRAGAAHVQQLERFCADTFCSTQLDWQCEGEGEVACSATLRLPLCGVMHTFHGPTQATAEAACGELARRVLWCLGCKAVAGKLQPDPQMLLGSNCKVSPAPEF
eukprot:CAMPEP_0178424978 /NCGR_PEP_ID=MMETSP0689_2-20121128/28488_1 /TAXON_ID=160604 /ORGANISM="Amphidinium massartii, Strain CS-259" /LENGTH=337 /DNA_ID=CAMNT_0020046631 /DNA_START=77 /DNA_END=1087 /DNA_ORIENTATION=+